MSKQKTDLSTLVAESQPVNVLSGTQIETVADAGNEILPIVPFHVFRDTKYTSRTLVMSDGRTIPVAKGRVTAVTDEQLEFLNAHPDLELLQG